MLSVYQENHLLPAYRHHGPRLYAAMVEASRAHLVMLGERGVLPTARAGQLLAALERLRGREVVLPDYDGTFEDVYFALERTLAEEAGIPQGELDLQLARSRNDLDAAVFRMLLRREVVELLGLLLDSLEAMLDAADRGIDTTVMALTHRRPAQPTSIGHVLAGAATELQEQAAAYLSALDGLNRSPLGAAAIAGTDLPIDSARLAELLGFDSVLPNAYAAVAGADHFAPVASTNARVLATGARIARVLQEWMSWGWIETPAEFCQGSSAMPQKRNPVVLEHMASMAVAAVADLSGVLGSIATAWWEDSNTATTDIQVRLWESDDRTARFLRMYARLFQTVQPQSPPSDSAMIEAGTTTTAAADALSLVGVPFRSAHGLLSALLHEGAPENWDVELVKRVADARGAVLPEGAAEAMLEALRTPAAVLDRAQAEGPGREAVAGQIALGREVLAGLRAQLSAFEEGQGQAQVRLEAAVRQRLQDWSR